MGMVVEQLSFPEGERIGRLTVACRQDITATPNASEACPGPL